VGLLTEYFAATPTELATLDLRMGPRDWPGAVLTNGITDIELTALEHILCGGVLEELYRREPDWVSEGGPDGPWVMRLSAPLVNSLTGLTSAEVPLLAERWVATEDLAGKHVVAADAAAFLGELVAVARAANAQRRDLYLWMSL
jgi:hypothetical protein